MKLPTAKLQTSVLTPDETEQIQTIKNELQEMAGEDIQYRIAKLTVQQIDFYEITVVDTYFRQKLIILVKPEDFDKDVLADKLNSCHYQYFRDDYSKTFDPYEYMKVLESYLPFNYHPISVSTSFHMGKGEITNTYKLDFIELA